mmetsp:Transcript_23909/g.79458  ORF Transcript_23909/g.79458 Transcript_23909/m.79458 type:complete len:261 (+) Transcript_23909:2450-3232(+)
MLASLQPSHHRLHACCRPSARQEAAPRRRRIRRRERRRERRRGGGRGAQRGRRGGDARAGWLGGRVGRCDVDGDVAEDRRDAREPRPPRRLGCPVEARTQRLEHRDGLLLARRREEEVRVPRNQLLVRAAERGGLLPGRLDGERRPHLRPEPHPLVHLDPRPAASLVRLQQRRSELHAVLADEGAVEAGPQLRAASSAVQRWRLGLRRALVLLRRLAKEETAAAALLWREEGVGRSRLLREKRAGLFRLHIECQPGLSAG